MGITQSQDLGILKTTDMGKSWKQTLNGYEVLSIAIDSIGNIFSGTNSGVWKSLDDGNSWTQISSLTITGIVFSVSIGNNNEVFLGTSNGVFKSTDNGTTFSSINNGLSNTSIVQCIYALPNGYIFACVNYGGIYRSTDDGISWSLNYNITSKIGGLNVMNIFPTASGEIYLATERYGILQSGDFGNTWQQHISGLTQSSFDAITVDKNNYVYAGSLDGVFISKSNGLTWSKSVNGMIATAVNALITKDSLIYAGTIGGLFSSNDKGNNWMQVNDNSLTYPYINCLANDKNGNFYAGTLSAGIYFSSNNGTSWDSLGPNITTNCIEINKLNYIYVGTDSGIYYSKNLGKSWTAVDNALKNLDISTLALDTTDNLFAGTSGAIYRSTDYGTTWDSLNVYANWVSSIAIDKKNTIFVGTFSGIIKSTDDGISWSNVNIQYPSLHVQKIFISRGNDIYVAAQSQELLSPYATYFILIKSTDQGSTWQNISSGLPINAISSIDEDSNGDIYIGTVGQGVYILNINTLDVKIDQNLITNYSLSNNYPNPFNPVTTINYTIAVKDFVTIKVYDLLGKEIATLVNEEKNSGSYSVEFNASKLSSGVYFYRMQAGGFVETKKLILLK
ncbi:MAG: T9SS type A sorting domain-containing protein [Ignavibacteriaceae bacterium]